MEFVTSTVASIVTKIAESFLAPFGRPFGYLIHYNRNIKDLQELVERLHDKEAGLKLDSQAAKRRGDVIAPAVDTWLKKVDGLNVELGKFLDEDVKVTPSCFNGRCPDLKSRYSLSRKAKKKIQQVIKLQQDGKFNKTSYPALLNLRSAFTDSLSGFPSRVLVMNRVLEALKNDKMNMIGVCGMGGVGKTTLVKEVIRGADSENLFDEIVMAVVSQTPEPLKIQGAIAERIGLGLEEGCVSVRARRLYHRLKEIQRILIILDDVWAELDLEEIGIPFGDDHHGCKVVVASRMEDVCNKMKSQMNFRISVLSEIEAWDLFQEMAGQLVDNAHILPIANEVAKECGGLPLAIVTVAKALRDKDRCIWEDALKQLKKSTITSFSEMHECVFSRIELSYRYLKNEEASSCFLLCSLFPEDFNIPVEYLVRYGVGLRLFKGIDSIGDARNRVQMIVDKLKRSFLLVESDKEGYVKMHDVVRDVAISIASKGEYKFLVRCDSQVKEWPNEDTYEHYTASSIVFEKINECAGSPRCPKLQLLQLSCRNPLQNVPYNLLVGMKQLKVLALQGMSILSQPPHLEVLRELRTLHLEHCEIKDALIIGALENLEILSLVGSRVSELPTEIGKLRRLRLLDVTECSFVKGIPPGVLSNLSQLEELYMRESFYRWESVKEEHKHNVSVSHLEKKRYNANVAELKCLSHLKALDIHIPDARCLPKEMPFDKLTRFKISIRSGISDKGLYLFQNNLKIEADATDIVESGIYELLRKTEVLSLNLTNLKNVLCSLDGEGFPCLKNLMLDSCSDMECIIDDGDLFPYTAFPALESLYLSKLVNLREILRTHQCDGSSFLKGIEVLAPCVQEPLRRQSTQLSCFGNLKFLNVSGCCKLKNVFLASMARGLEQLQGLYVGSCVEMEEILLEEEDEDVFAFPKLTNMRLFILPKLISFCKGTAKWATLRPSGKLSGSLELRGYEMSNVKEIQEDQSEPISCKLYSSRWISRLLNLEKLEVHGCKLLQVLFDLETLRVEDLKETNQMLMKLEEMRLYFLPELTHVWSKVPKGFLGFERLKVLSVERCNSLKYLFSPLIVKRLVDLEMIYVEDCAIMESIVSRQVGEVEEGMSVVIFHKVNSIHLRNLPKLESFCPDPYILELPSLNILHLTECSKLKIFGSTIQSSIKPMQNHVKHGAKGSSIMQNIDLSTSDLSQVHFSDDFIGRCFGCSTFYPTKKYEQGISVKEGALPNLVDSNVTDGTETSSCGLFNIMIGHQHLRTLELSFCELVEVVFNLEEDHTSLVLNDLETLTLMSLPKLMHIWKMNVQQIMGFQNLKQLEVHECNNLKSLIPSVIAGLLVKLEVIKITACELIEEIIARGEVQKTDMIMFPQLNSITLCDLPNLSKFCSQACAVEFPVLMTMKMVGCPKLKTFVSANVLSPRLKMILAESSSYALRGDLNDTIQQIFKGKKLFEPIEDKFQFTFPYTEVVNDVTHLCSSSSSYRGSTSINGTKGEKWFDGYESLVNKGVEGDRKLEDVLFEGYEAEVKSKNAKGKMWCSIYENERGKQDKDALEEHGARETKRSIIGKNWKVSENGIRMDAREKTREFDESIDGDRAGGRDSMDDFLRERVTSVLDTYGEQGASSFVNSNNMEYINDDVSEGNVGSFIIPTSVIAVKDNTWFFAQRTSAAVPNFEIITDPPVASTSQGDGARTNLTQFRIGAYADFYGFEVESHYVSYLERFYNVEGAFWGSCIFKSGSGISFLLNMLGGALQTLDNVLKSLTYKELKLIRESIEDVSKAGFRVESLMPILMKVKVIIEACEKQSRYECLEREMNALEMRLGEINCEMVTLQQDLRSEIVGDDFSVNYFSIQY